MNDPREPNDRGRLDIAAPCPERWSDLEGDGARRFCDKCSLHVVDGAALTRLEAEAMVLGSQERVCMRLLKDADGQSIHRPEPARTGVLDRLVRYGLTAAAGVLAACGDDRESPAKGPAGPDGGSETVQSGGNEGGGPPLELLGYACGLDPEPIAPVGGPEIDGELQLRTDVPPPSTEVMGTPGPLPPPSSGESGGK